MAEPGGAVVGLDGSPFRWAGNVSLPTSVAQALPATAVAVPSAAVAGLVAGPLAARMPRLVAAVLPV